MTLVPKPYQTTGIEFLANADVAILGDDAGLGKSMQMIRAAEKRGAQRILVVCPTIGRVSWADQFATWQTVTPPKPFYVYPDDTAGMIPCGPIAMLVTMEWLATGKNAKIMLQALAHADPFDVMFIDEGHFLKTPTAKRTRAVYGPRLDMKSGLGGSASACWLASATLTPNHAGELYPHLRALMPDLLRTLFKGELPRQAEFVERYCTTQHTPFGVKITGNNGKTIPELAWALRPRILARRKEDVLQDLPPINPVLLPFSTAAAPKANTDPSFIYLDQTLAGVNENGTYEQIEEALAALSAYNNKDLSISTLRRELGLAKVAPAVSWISNFLLNKTHKLVVFAHHREIIDQLFTDPALQEFSPVRLYGATSAAEKQEAVSAFQTNPATRLLIGQTVSAGTSITLTAASDVLLLEPDWTPVNNYQAICRCHRIGQPGSVTAYFAHAAGTLDERIVRILRRKAKDFAQLFGGQTRGHV